MSAPVSDALSSLLPPEAEARGTTEPASSRQPSQLSAAAAEWRPTLFAAAAADDPAISAGECAAHSEFAWQAADDVPADEVLQSPVVLLLS